MVDEKPWSLLDLFCLMSWCLGRGAISGCSIATSASPLLLIG